MIRSTANGIASAKSFSQRTKGDGCRERFSLRLCGSFDRVDRVDDGDVVKHGHAFVFWAYSPCRHPAWPNGHQEHSPIAEGKTLR